MSNITIGLDISKDKIDAAKFPSQEAHQFDNDAPGHKKLILWMGMEVKCVVFEPTGSYHRQLEQALALAQLPCLKVNPRSARYFAKAFGKLAKTDKVDALMLAQMGAHLPQARRELPTAAMQNLKELACARRSAVKDKVALKNRLHKTQASLLKRQYKAMLKLIERQIEDIDQLVENLIKQDKTMQQQLELLISIPGIGKATAMTLLIEMPELGTLNEKQAAALAGLAPITRQSGQWRGRAFIQGGRKTLRQALYMPALVAIQHCYKIKQKYQTLIDNGKQPKVAITAIMRKMIVIANAIIKNNQKWNNYHT